MSFFKHINCQISAFITLNLVFMLSLSSVTYSETFLIRDGETRTTLITVDDGDSVVIEEGGALKTNGDDGIFGSDVDNFTLNNRGTLSTMGDDSDGLRLNDSSSDFTVNNYGSIKTEGSNSHALHFLDNTDDGFINNYGSIKTGTSTSSDSHGIFLDGFSDNVIIKNDGTIKTMGSDSDGIRIGDSSDDNIIHNYGSISTKRDNSNGIRIGDGSDDNTFHNYGSISTKGDSSNGINFLEDNNRNLVHNYGSISTMGANGDGIQFDEDADDNIIKNFRNGSIMTSGSDARGIFIRDGSDDNIINNFGKIVTSGDGVSHAIEIDDEADNNTINNFYTGIIQTRHSDPATIRIGFSSGTEINNRGRILAASPSDTAIFDLGDSDITLNILPGSKIVGEIDFNGGDDIINIDSRRMAGSSFTVRFVEAADGSDINTFGRNVLNIGGTSGFYQLVDPSGQSAKGAALGSLTDGIHTAITQRLGNIQNARPTQVASTRVDMGMMPVRNRPIAWVTGIGQHRTRERDDQVMAYDHDYYGGIGGYEMNFGNLRAGAMVGYARSDFATDLWSIQTDTDSFFGGVYGQMEFSWLNVSSTLMLGYEDISNDRLVVDNANGFETAEADYDNFFLSPSVTLSAPLKLNDKTVITPLVTGTYSVGFQDGYTESGTTRSNLMIDDRTIHVFLARVQVGVTHKWTSRIDTQARLGFKARNVSDSLINATLAGSTFQYATSGDDNVLGGYFGINGRYRITDSINIMLDGEYTVSEGLEYSANGQLGAEFIF